jgi:hypothetical protein
MKTVSMITLLALLAVAHAQESVVEDKQDDVPLEPLESPDVLSLEAPPMMALNVCTYSYYPGDTTYCHVWGGWVKVEIGKVEIGWVCVGCPQTPPDWFMCVYVLCGCLL